MFHVTTTATHHPRGYRLAQGSTLQCILCHTGSSESHTSCCLLAVVTLKRFMMNSFHSNSSIICIAVLDQMQNVTLQIQSYFIPESGDRGLEDTRRSKDMRRANTFILSHKNHSIWTNDAVVMQYSI